MKHTTLPKVAQDFIAEETARKKARHWGKQPDAVPAAASRRQITSEIWNAVLEQVSLEEREQLQQLMAQGLEGEIGGNRLLFRLPNLPEGQYIEPATDSEISQKLWAIVNTVPSGVNLHQAKEEAAAATVRTVLQPAQMVAYTLITDPQGLPDALAPLYEHKILALDTETTGLDPLVAKARLLQIAVPNAPVVLIDLFCIPELDRFPIQNLLQQPSVKVFHNAKFDLKFLKQARLGVGGQIFDSMLATQLLDAGVKAHGHTLADVVEEYLGEALPKELQVSNWAGDLTAEQLQYAARDAAILLRVREALIPKLQATRLIDTAKLEFDCVRALAEIELNGMLLDIAKWEILSRELGAAKDEAAAEMKQQLKGTGQDTLFGEEDINLDSQPQMVEALKKLGVPVTDTSKQTLYPLAPQYPVIKALMRYRKAAKSVQAFASSLPKHIHQVTGRIHPDYQQMGAATGRLSCRDPNLQQVPRDKTFRSCFIPAPGYKLVIADYSQIELRVAAEISGDVRMTQAYSNGEDLHRLTASLVAGKDLGQITKEERQEAKAVNFGLIYAMGAPGLQAYALNTYGVEMTLEQAQAFRKQFFKAYSGIANWHANVRRAAPRETRTLCGRRRRWADEPRMTEIYNSPVQGSAADIVKKALALLMDALEGTGIKLIGTVHDEILLEAPEDRVDDAATILADAMQRAGKEYLTRVPVEAEVMVVASWAEK